MAEIKSTIDLIMEKLKKMEITEEEKKEIARKEARERAKRILARYTQRPNIYDVMKELEEISEEKRRFVEEELINECIEVIEPFGARNQDVLKLMQEIIKKDVSSLKDLILSFEKQLEEEKRRYERYLLERLKNRGISGSAVIPNIEADSGWKKRIEDEKKRLHSYMNDLISKLK